jgi:Chaperone of endosialidase
MGGTGLSVSGPSGNYLRSDGSNWVSARLLTSDVPDLAASYIKNGLTVQLGASFTISGNGMALGTLSGGSVNASNQYNLGGVRVLSNAGANNLFAGVNAGAANSGSNNSFFGRDAGLTNTTGSNNSFVGNGAGRNNNQGFNNSFFGKDAGFSTTNSNSNSFFGNNAGFANTVGNDNSYFGKAAGAASTVASNNSFFGRDAGLETVASNNSFFGRGAGAANSSGTDNSFFGQNAGAKSVVGSHNTLIGSNANVVNAFIEYGTAIGAGSVVQSNNTVALGRPDGSDIVRTYGKLIVGDLSGPGGTPLCQWLGQLMSCFSSSLRYKTAVQTFKGGLNVVDRLRPISFSWKVNGNPDIGFAAEEVAQIEPLLALYNEKGEVEGVKYNQISVVLVNSVKEQQAQIMAQEAQIKRLLAAQTENQQLKVQLARISLRLEKIERKRARKRHR